MSKKYLSINFPIERVVLSDLLPFEIPIIFSNRHFYKFLVKNGIKFESNVFMWIKVDTYIDKLILLLLGLEQSTKLIEKIINNITYQTATVEQSQLPSIAFTFPISHKLNKFRYLSIIHPRGQVQCVNFYEKYKDLVTYYSNVSPLSLRSAKRVSGCTFIDKKTLIESYDTDESGIEIDGQNYENLTSFFVYKKYKNIFEFYESSDHHWCEQRFNYLSKLDVSNCFDSIYTHSLSWAVSQKSYIKNNLSRTKNTFASKFDQLMQKINYNETNGILIGPELSRIFAEIIMQSIDNDVISDLKQYGYTLSIDYQIYRYVDDYFIFYNEENIFKNVRNSIQTNLKYYKLSLNTHKEETYSRPIITPITIAKKKIADIISDKIKYKECDDNQYSIYIHQGSLSTNFKSILADSGVTYTDILNYTLSIIEKKIKKTINDYESINICGDKNKQFVNAIVSIINFSYFIYSVAPKVNSTIKLCRIIQQVILFMKKNEIGKEHQHIIFKCIFDNSCSILEKYAIDKSSPIETLYLLVLIRQLGKYYWLDETILINYFNINKSGKNFEFPSTLNYFSIISLLFYISDKTRYNSVRNGLLKHISNIYDMAKDTLLDNAEMIHLTLDLISCPYITLSFKKTLLSRYGIDSKIVKNMILKNKFWFTKWSDFNFSKELDAKLGKNVY